MNVPEIKSDASKHVALCMCIFVAILCLARCVMAIAKISYTLAKGLPLAVAFVFAVFETVIVTMLWLRTSTLHRDRLQTLHTAVAGFRLLAALIIMLIAYIIVGRDKIMPYVAWMILYYFVLLILHSTFFARENRKLFDKDQ